jgi:hypothetical protein
LINSISLSRTRPGGFGRAQRGEPSLAGAERSIPGAIVVEELGSVHRGGSEGTRRTTRVTYVRARRHRLETYLVVRLEHESVVESGSRRAASTAGRGIVRSGDDTVRSQDPNPADERTDRRRDSYTPKRSCY